MTADRAKHRRDLAVEREREPGRDGSSCAPGAEAAIVDLLRAERHATRRPVAAARQQPAGRAVGRLGDLRAGHVQRVGPGARGDSGRAPSTSRGCAAPTRRTARAARATLRATRSRSRPSRCASSPDRARRAARRDRAPRDPRAVGPGELLAVAADQLAGQRATALRPRRDVRRVAHVPVAAAPGALLALPVDGHLRGRPDRSSPPRADRGRAHGQDARRPWPSRARSAARDSAASACVLQRGRRRRRRAPPSAELPSRAARVGHGLPRPWCCAARHPARRPRGSAPPSLRPR